MRKDAWYGYGPVLLESEGKFYWRLPPQFYKTETGPSRDNCNFMKDFQDARRHDRNVKYVLPDAGDPTQLSSGTVESQGMHAYVVHANGKAYGLGDSSDAQPIVFIEEPLYDQYKHLWYPEVWNPEGEAASEEEEEAASEGGGGAASEEGETAKDAWYRGPTHLQLQGKTYWRMPSRFYGTATGPAIDNCNFMVNLAEDSKNKKVMYALPGADPTRLWKGGVEKQVANTNAYNVYANVHQFGLGDSSDEQPIVFIEESVYKMYFSMGMQSLQAIAMNTVNEVRGPPLVRYITNAKDFAEFNGREVPIININNGKQAMATFVPGVTHTVNDHGDTEANASGGSSGYAPSTP